MFRRFVPFLGASAIAVAALLVVAEPAAAQRDGRRGGFSVGYSPWSGVHAGYNTGYYSPYSGNYSPYYGGYYGPRYYNDGYSPYQSQYYGARYAPDTYGYSIGSNMPVLSNSYREDARVSMYPPEDTTAVRISVRVSPTAQIWFDGTKTTQTGGIRQFVSPPIDDERERTYEIRARWTEGGQEVDQTRKVSFHAGDRLTVNFMTPSLQGADVKGTREVLTPTSPAGEKFTAPPDFQKRDK